MSKQKLKQIRRKLKNPQEYYKEALHYFDNAKELLKEVKIEHDRYKDAKKVRQACALCYLSALFALDGYFTARGVTPDKLSDSTEGYWALLDKYLIHDGKITDAFDTVWENLHVLGYYRGGVGVPMIKDGFQKAKLIINTLSKITPKEK